MRILVNAFLLAYALDAGLSLLDDALAHGADYTGLRAIRGAVAALVFFACPLVYLAAALTPRVPKRIVLPPAIFILWWGLGAVPLALFVTSPTARSVLAAMVQALLAAGAFALVRRRHGSWLLPRGASPHPAFRLRYTAAFVAIHLLLAFPFGMTWLALAIAQDLAVSSAGFASFGREGLEIVERRYRGPDGEVLLVGMIHVAEAPAYRAVFASFAEEETVVLEEGVTGLDALLGAPFTYEPLAEAVGLEMQPALKALREELAPVGEVGVEPWPHLRHADVDASEFSEQTIEILERIARVVSAEDLRSELIELGGFVSDGGPTLWLAVDRDLIALRNRRALEELDSVIGSYGRVVIPWGALHMPGIEHGVRSRGFEPTEERRHLALRYRTILAALWDGLRAVSR